MDGHDSILLMHLVHDNHDVERSPPGQRQDQLNPVLGTRLRRPSRGRGWDVAGGGRVLRNVRREAPPMAEWMVSGPGGVMAHVSSATTRELDDLIAEITTDCNGEDEALSSFEVAVLDGDLAGDANAMRLVDAYRRRLGP